MTDVHELLVRARARIADPEHWTRNAFARNRCGGPVVPRDQDAARWCALGALMAESEDADSRPSLVSIAPAAPSLVRQATVALEFVSPYARNYGLPGYNDAHPHEAVLALFDRAIAATAPPRHATPEPRQTQDDRALVTA